MVTIPLELCFAAYDDLPSYSRIRAFNYFVDVVFFVEVILNFHVPFYSETREAYVAIRTDIAKRYFEFWVFVDLLSCIPFEVFYELAVNNMVSNASNSSLYNFQSLLYTV